MKLLDNKKNALYLLCSFRISAYHTLRLHLSLVQFIVFTDWNALQFLLNALELFGDVMRWRFRSTKFDIDTRYRKGM